MLTHIARTIASKPHNVKVPAKVLDTYCRRHGCAEEHIEHYLHQVGNALVQYGMPHSTVEKILNDVVKHMAGMGRLRHGFLR